LRREALLHDRPEVREVPFDPEIRMMATVHAEPGGFFHAVKGSPEALLEVCSDVRSASGVHPLDAAERSRWIAHNRALAARGLRCLAVGSKRTARADDPFRASRGWNLRPPRSPGGRAPAHVAAPPHPRGDVTRVWAPTARTVADGGLLDPPTRRPRS
jgi:hypothetical protein